jgi:hypothetical protein
MHEPGGRKDRFAGASEAELLERAPRGGVPRVVPGVERGRPHLQGTLDDGLRGLGGVAPAPVLGPQMKAELQGAVLGGFEAAAAHRIPA